MPIGPRRPPEEGTNNEVPRRNNLALFKPSEIAILKAMAEVENMGADPTLTEAIIKLQEVRKIISDYIDSNEAK
jgi:hypothetical protein